MTIIRKGSEILDPCPFAQAEKDAAAAAQRLRWLKKAAAAKREVAEKTAVADKALAEKASAEKASAKNTRHGKFATRGNPIGLLLPLY